jgi:hypothetical protein
LLRVKLHALIQLGVSPPGYLVDFLPLELDEAKRGIGESEAGGADLLPRLLEVAVEVVAEVVVEVFLARAASATLETFRR